MNFYCLIKEIMKKVLMLIFSFSIFVSIFMAFTNAGYVNGYYRSNGTYVNSYYRSNANALKYDNYSYKPSQGLYNSSYNSTKNYNSNWYTTTTTTQSNYYQWLNYYKTTNKKNSRTY